MLLSICRTLGIIKPDSTAKMGQILDVIYQKGFMITQLKMCQLNRNEAFQLYQEHQGKPFLEWVLKLSVRLPLLQIKVT